MNTVWVLFGLVACFSFGVIADSYPGYDPDYDYDDRSIRYQFFPAGPYRSAGFPLKSSEFYDGYNFGGYPGPVGQQSRYQFNPSGPYRSAGDALKGTFVYGRHQV